MIPTYASFREKPPANAFAASAISGSAASLSRNFRIQLVNRAGRSLLSDPISITSTGVRISLTNQYEDGEEIFWIAISVETTGIETDAGIIYLWQAREPDQLTRRSLPIDIDFIADSELTTNQAVNTVSLLPSSGFLPGAIVETLDTNVYYRFDPEAFTDIDGRLYSYGALAKGLGQWIEYPFTHNAYVPSVAGAESSDRRINTVSTTLKVPPKIGAVNGISERYWLNNGLLNNFGTPIINGKYSLEIFINGIDYSSVFADRIAFYLVGYVDRLTGILDTSMAGVGVRKLWNPTHTLIELPIDLPYYAAAVFDFRLEFNNDDLVGVLPSQQVELELDIVEVLNVTAKVSEFAKALGDLVMSEHCKFLIVPGLERLGGVATFAAGYIAEDPNSQMIAGVLADTPDQEVTISGSLNGFADLKQAGDAYAHSEVLRATVSSEPGISRLIASSQITLNSEKIEVTIDHPLTATNAGIIRSDYPDQYLAGLDKAIFTPTKIYFAVEIAGVPHQTIQAISPVASETFTIDIADLTAISTLPVQSDNWFGLFEPTAIAVTSASGGGLSGSAIVHAGYIYESPNLKVTKIDHTGTNAVPTLNSTLAQAINNGLLRPNNLSDLADVAIARNNLDVYDKAYIDNHVNDTNNPHQVTTAQIGAATIANLATTNNRVTTNEADILLNTNFRTSAGTGATLDAGTVIDDLVQVVDVDGNGLAGLPAIDGSQLTGIGGQLLVEFASGTVAATVSDLNPVNYLIDTSGAIATINLPASPPDKGIVAFSDRNKTFSTNNATVTPDPAHTINGQANFLLDFDNEAVTLVFDAANNNYVVLDGIQNTSTGAGDMSQSVYDTDGNGIVDSAEEVDGIATAGNDKFYGTDAAGVPGFYDYLVGAAVKAALEAIADPDKLLFGATNNARDISQAPIDDYCLTYDLTSDSVVWRPRIQVAGAGAILIPISQSMFEIPDGAIATYVPDVGTMVFTDVKILTTAATPDNQIVNEELIINIVNTGAVLDLGVSDTVLRTDWTFNTGDISCLIARYDSDGNMVILELSGTAIALKTVVADTITTVATEPFTFATGTTYEIELQIIGVTYTALIDGVEILQDNTNDFLTATKFGIGRIA